MSKLESNRRISILINCLRKRPHTTDELLQELKKHSELDERKYYCSVRTLQREFKEITSQFDTEIKFNKKTNCYEITNEIKDDQNERLIEAFDMISALNLNKQLSSCMIFEKRKPLGMENLFGIIHAIKSSQIVQFEYVKYWEGNAAPTLRNVHPLGLKEAQSRWYLIAQDTNDKKIKTFGVDRISNFEISKEKFEYPANYNPEEAFKNSFGIISENGEPQKIILSFTNEQGKYIKSLPLHHSQKEIKTTSNEYVISLYLYPTYDFEMEILSLGNQVKVIEPQSLQTRIKQKLQQALERY